MTSSSITQNLVSVTNGDLTTTSLAIAAGTENEHASVIKLVRTYQADLEGFGRVGFEIQPFETNGGAQQREIAILNERQATLLISYMRNSEIVREFKMRLVREFYEMAAKLMVPNFADPVAAARAWADAYEAKQIAQQQIKLLEEQREADRPYTDLAKAITGESTMIIRDWISMMKDEYGGHIKEKKVRDFLHDSGYWYWTQTSPRETRVYAQFDHLFKLETELCSGMPRLLLKITGRGVLELTPIVVRHFEK